MQKLDPWSLVSHEGGLAWEPNRPRRAGLVLVYSLNHGGLFALIGSYRIINRYSGVESDCSLLIGNVNRLVDEFFGSPPLSPTKLMENETAHKYLMLLALTVGGKAPSASWLVWGRVDWAKGAWSERPWAPMFWCLCPCQPGGGGRGPSPLISGIKGVFWNFKNNRATPRQKSCRKAPWWG